MIVVAIWPINELASTQPVGSQESQKICGKNVFDVLRRVATRREYVADLVEIGNRLHIRRTLLASECAVEVGSDHRVL